MNLREENIRMIQINGPQRKVCIKLISHYRKMAVFKNTPGPLEHKHENGVLSMVQGEVAGMGIENVRVANLPPETPNRILQEALSKYGEERRITEEQ
jgi:hypothetical protein